MNPDLPNTLPPELPDPKRTLKSDPPEKTAETLSDPLQTTDQPQKPATTPATPPPVPSAPSVKPKVPSTLPSSAIPSGYEILGTLGRGGMGVVYKALQRKANRQVALKMILSADHASDIEKQRFQTEAEAIAQLDHPNIVKVFDVGEHDGKPYFALEFCNGGSLAEKIQQNPLTAKKAAEIVAEVAEGMAHAHENGILHRDLKPANILLTSTGQPKITDFGLAKRVSEESGQTRTGAVMGTPSFMAPEQALGDTKYVTEKADIYSLGAILYDCLTGRPPFKGANVMETLDQVRNREPVPPSQLNPSIPADLETICLKCLQKEPYKRYANANELAADLTRYLDGKPIKARRVGAIEKSWKWIKRNKLVSGLVSGIFAVLVVSVALVASAYLAEAKARSDAVDFGKNEEAAKIEAKASERKAKEEEEKAKSAQAKAEIERQLKAEETEKAKKSEEIAQKERAIAIRNLTNLNTNLAFRALIDNDPAQAEIFLEKVPESERCWDWYHLKQMAVGELIPGWTPGKKATSISLHPQGRALAIGHNDSSVSVWDLAELKKMLDLKQEKDPTKPDVQWKTHKVIFSPDGKHLISLHSYPTPEDPRAESVVNRWNLAEGKRVESVRLPTFAKNMSHSTEGKIAVPGYNGTIYLLDATGKLDKEWSYQLPASKQRIWLETCDFLQPTRLIGLSTVGHFLVWNCDTKQLILNEQSAGEIFTSLLNRPGLTVMGTNLGPVRIGDENNQVGSLFAVNRETGDPHILRGHTGAVRALAYCEDADISQTERAGETRNIAVGGGEISVPVGGGNTPKFRIATGGDDGIIRIWRSRKQVSLIRTNRAVGISELEWSRVGHLLVSLDANGDVRFWNPGGSGATTIDLAHTNRVYAMGFEPKNGEMLGTGDFSGFVKLWSTDLQSPMLILRAHSQMVTSVSISPGGQRMVTTGRDGMLHIWDIPKRKRIKTLRHTYPVYADLSPDGTTVAYVQRLERKLFFLNINTGEIIGEMPIVLVGDSIKWSPDGKYVSIASFQSLHVYDVQTKTQKAEISTLLPLLGDHVWYPDSKRVALMVVPKTSLGSGISFSSGSLENGGVLRVHDIENNKPLWKTRTLSQKVSVTPDGKRLVTVGRDGVKVYESDSGQETLAMPGVGEGVDSMVFAPYRKGVGYRLAFTTSNFFLPHMQDSGMGPREVNPYIPSSLHLWDGPPALRTQMIRGHNDLISEMTYSSKADVMLTTSLAQVNLWRGPKFEQVRLLESDNTYNAFAALRPDGKEFLITRPLVAQKGEVPSTLVQFFSIDNPTVSLREMKIPVPSCHLSYSPDGIKLLVCVKQMGPKKELLKPENETGIWDAQTGQFLTPVIEAPGSFKNFTEFGVWSADGERLLTRTINSTIFTVWDNKGKKLWSYDGISQATFHPDQKQLVLFAYATQNKKANGFQLPQFELLFVNRDTGEPTGYTFPAHQEFGITIGKIAISPDGKILAISGVSGRDESSKMQTYLIDVAKKKIFQTIREPYLAGKFGVPSWGETLENIVPVTALTFKSDRELTVGYTNGAFRSYPIDIMQDADGEMTLRPSLGYSGFLKHSLYDDYLSIVPMLFLKKNRTYLPQLQRLESRANMLCELIPESQAAKTVHGRILHELIPALPDNQAEQRALFQAKLDNIEKAVNEDTRMILQDQIKFAEVEATNKLQDDPKLSAELYQFCIGVLTKLLQEYPKDQNYLSRMLECRRSYAAALSASGQHSESLKAYDEVIAMIPPENQLEFKAMRTLLVARSGDHQKATAEIDNLLRGVRAGLASFLHARTYAVALSVVASDTKLTDEQKANLTKTYTDRALGHLNQSKMLGAFNDAAAHKVLKTNKDFATFRNTDEGKKFIEDLAPKKK